MEFNMMLAKEGSEDVQENKNTSIINNTDKENVNENWIDKKNC